MLQINLSIPKCTQNLSSHMNSQSSLNPHDVPQVLTCRNYRARPMLSRSAFSLFFVVSSLATIQYTVTIVTAGPKEQVMIFLGLQSVIGCVCHIRTIVEVGQY